LGPKDIIGDLELDNGQHLIITGTIHVTGNVNVGNHGSITLDPAYGSNSGMLIADGTIHLENNGTMHGSGSPGSSLMLITHATGGGHHDSAIDIHNGANGTIFYAPNGTINLHNTATVSQLTADGITMSEGARLTYDQGFLDARFTSGPAAAWTLVPGTWAAR
ncbi:hypothetical protein HY480_04050, partial [Candidatus Uhrbacteria bacterium]|nr:hypothetical protein [Candidatus Uhrbacteria bacterium]